MSLKIGDALLIPVVVVFVPVVLLVPAVLVLVPPAMTFLPALFPRFVQFAPFVIGLAAVAAMTLDRFVQFVLGVLGAPPATFIHIGLTQGPWKRNRRHQSRSNAHRQYPRPHRTYACSTMIHAISSKRVK